MAYRILIVTSDNFPVTRVDVEVLFGREVAGRGYAVDMIAQSEAPCEKSYLARWSGGVTWVGATDLGASLLHRVRKHLRGLRADLKLVRWLASGSYDLLIVKDKFLSAVLGLVVARLTRRPFAFWLSYPFPEAYLERARERSGRYPRLYVIRGHAFRFLLYRILLPRAIHVFAQSAQMVRDLAREGVDPAKMTAVPMGVLPSMFPERSGNEPRRLLPRDAPCIVYLGTLARARHLDFLLRVLQRLRLKRPDALLYLVGRGDDPTDDAFLAQEASRLGLGSAVVMTGQLPRADALEFVAEADVCVSPFYPSPVLNSTSPTKLVEYLAMGKAVVANDHPEQRQLIEQSGAGLCVPYDEQAFADALDALLADPERRRAMGARGRPYVLANRTYEVIGRDVEAVLRQIIARSERRT